MRRARVSSNGQVQYAFDLGNERIKLADGRICHQHEVDWLPPIRTPHHHRARAQLRGPCQRTRLQGALGTARFSETGQQFRGAPLAHREAGRRRLHALRVRVGGGDRTALPQRQRSASLPIRGRIYGRQRLRHPRLPRELLPAQPAGQRPRHLYSAGPVAGHGRRDPPTR